MCCPIVPTYLYLEDIGQFKAGCFPFVGVGQFDSLRGRGWRRCSCGWCGRSNHSVYYSGSRSIYRYRNVDVRLVIDDDAARFALVRWLPHKIRGFVGARFKAVICFFQEWLS
jgi:hypothetical protein